MNYHNQIIAYFQILSLVLRLHTTDLENSPIYCGMRRRSVGKMIPVPLSSEFDIKCPIGQPRILISSHYDCPTFIRLSVIKFILCFRASWRSRVWRRSGISTSASWGTSRCLRRNTRPSPTGLSSSRRSSTSSTPPRSVTEHYADSIWRWNPTLTYCQAFYYRILIHPYRTASPFPKTRREYPHRPRRNINRPTRAIAQRKTRRSII